MTFSKILKFKFKFNFLKTQFLLLPLMFLIIQCQNKNSQDLSSESDSLLSDYGDLDGRAVNTDQLKPWEGTFQVHSVENEQAQLFAYSNCKVDIDLTMKPLPNVAAPTNSDLQKNNKSKKSKVKVWKPKTPLQRYALLLSPEVQNNSLDCQYFAIAMKTELNISTPVSYLFYDRLSRLSDSGLVVNMKTDLPKNKNLTNSFKNYFKNKAMTNCSQVQIEGESFICATNISSPTWVLNQTKITSSNGRSVIKVQNVSAGFYGLDVYSSKNKTKAITKLKLSIDTQPEINLNCQANSEKIICKSEINNLANLEVLTAEWFINGDSISPNCFFSQTCEYKNPKDGLYGVQVFVRTRKNIVLKSRVNFVIIGNCSQTPEAANCKPAEDDKSNGQNNSSTAIALCPAGYRCLNGDTQNPLPCGRGKWSGSGSYSCIECTNKPENAKSVVYADAINTNQSCAIESIKSCAKNYKLSRDNKSCTRQ